MSRFISWGLLILVLVCQSFLFNNLFAFQSQTTTPDAIHGRHGKERQVVNIVLDKIENGIIHSRDGRTFQISSTTKIVNNANPSTSMRLAELTFENGLLVNVTIK